MQINCPRCDQPVEVFDEQTLDHFKCLHCSHEFGLLGPKAAADTLAATLDYRDETRTVGPSIDLNEDLAADGNESLVPSVFATMAAAIRERTFEGKEVPDSGTIHHYRIVEKLGQGGMGAVFSAEHVYLKRKVALKTVLSATTESESTRFLREAQVLALLSGPNVLSVQDAFVHEGIPYFVTELLEGKTLAQHIVDSGSMSLNQTLDMLEQIADVMRRHEELGIIHRDIKPSNIWLRREGDFCLFDYGLVGFRENGPTRSWARRESNQVMGTPMYMAPEQALDPDRVDHRTDLFGLGATAWECLTGIRPRATKGETAESLLRTIGYTPLRRVSELCEHIPTRFEKILDSLVALNPDNRYESVTDFIEDLERYRYGGRRPYGATKGTAFIAIPFSSRFENLFEFLEEVCGEAKLAARRVDRAPEMIDIWSQIQSEIEQATVVIAVFTRGRLSTVPNPNVITEAAHARAIGKPLIILTNDRAERLPFDWRHLPIIRYRDTNRGREQLMEDLLPRLRREIRR